MSEATIEVGGAVYALTSTTMHDNTQTYTTGSGDLYTMRIGAARAHVMTRDFAAQALVKGAPHPCRLMLGGTAYTGHVWVEGWSHSDQQVDLIVENLEAVPATPTLDELTDPADLDWGALRSAADDRRDWREAWGIVGTDHTGDATPGEVYLLSVARHKSATAAALHHWRELRERVIPLGKGNLSWQRIKGIAAWESSARAQYKPRTKSAWQRRAEWLNERIRPGDLHIPNEFQQEYQGIPAPVDALTYALLALYGGEDDAMTRGNGGVVGVLNNPYLSAAAQRGEITGTLTLTPDAVRALRDLTARVDAGARALGTAAATTLETVRQIDALTRSLNPAPRGPQTRKRR